MDAAWTPLIALHAGGATVAVVLGAFMVGRRTKGDLLHRRVGRLWMVDMYWVVFSSFAIKRLTPGHFSWIHLLSLWTLFSLTMALRAARAHHVRAHRGWAVGTYCGLLGAGAAALAFPTRLVPDTATHHPWWLLAGALAATAVAGIAVELAAVLPARRPVRTPQPSRERPASSAAVQPAHISLTTVATGSTESMREET